MARPVTRSGGPERRCHPPCSLSSILNSSSLCPDWRAATSHRGCLPRPDHVSVGTVGLQYLGRTLGYLRRGGRSVLAPGRELPASRLCSGRLSCARRFSSSSFSAVIFSDRIF